jgi:hypothetical protein
LTSQKQYHHSIEKKGFFKGQNRKTKIKKEEKKENDIYLFAV